MSSNSRFAYAPSVNIGRSKFGRSFSHKTTINTGDLIPIYWDDILPGDTISLDVKSLVRSLTVQAPVMDNAFITIEAYFVPNRTIWTHWVNFCGENDADAWTETTNYSVPVGYPVMAGLGSIGDYLGLPLGDYGVSGSLVSELPLRAYCKIWNEFWRDENYQAPKLFSTGDGQTSNAVYGYGSKPLKANKFHDYFTSVLPSPQKGDPVVFGIGSSAPVDGSNIGYNIAFENQSFNTSINFNSWSGRAGTGLPSKPSAYNEVGVANLVFTGDSIGQLEGLTVQGVDGSVVGISSAATTTIPGIARVAGSGVISGLTADLTNATAVSVNDIRMAFAVQKWLEVSARNGSRYYEYLHGMFGVIAPDAVLQNAQYLGGVRVPLNMETVVANSSGGDTVLGDMAGYSKTFGNTGRIVQSFTEHGILMVLATIRTSHTYSQGVPRKFLRKSIFDYYNPKFANIGEQAVKTIEIVSGNASADSVFGYQEAWADWRYNPNVVSGLMRPYIEGALSMWTYADDFSASMESATPGFIEEIRDNVDRTLASNDTFQWICDFYFDFEMVRPMPLFSIPGLVDHH